METLPYVVVALGASFLAVVAATYFALHHHEASNRVTILILLGSVVWLLMSALLVSSNNLLTKLVFLKAQFVGVFIIPATWLILTMQLSGYERWIKRSNLAMLSVVPTITLLLIFTNESHHLIWSNLSLNAVNPFLPLNETRGVGYWLLIVGYCYVVQAFALAVFVRRVVAPHGLYRGQTVPVIFACCVPWSLGALWFLNPTIFLYIDPMPLALTVATSILVWRLAYLPGADIVPVAHELILDSMDEAVVILDSQNRIVELNPAAQQLVGHSLQDALGQPAETVWAEWTAVKKELESETERFREVSFGVRERKRIYDVESSYLRGIVSKTPSTLIVLRDITERKLMDEKLRETERMAAIGETAAMVGHDLRNPLQGIAGALYILKQKWGETADTETLEMLEMIKGALEHADKIVKDLLDYSREIHVELTETTPRAITEAALLQVSIPGNVAIKNLTRDTPALRIDEAKMQRVFINLIANAIDAMPKGGELTIQSELSDRFVEIKFTDTGEGISEKVMQNLWKPLKTTKPKGIGLGLVICKSIVEAHGGSIQVDSHESKGSAFTIKLPITQNATLLAKTTS
jgi:PAS domain S-box-containing protein